MDFAVSSLCKILSVAIQDVQFYKLSIHLL